MHLPAALLVDQLVCRHGKVVLNIHEVPEKRLADLIHGKLAALPVGEVVDVFPDDGMHRLRQVEAMLAVQHVGDSAFPRLGIDADDRLVGSADVLRVDGQVGHAPHGRGVFLGFPFAAVEAFLDRVLVASGKRGEDQLSRVGLALRNNKAGEFLILQADVGEGGEIQSGFDPVAVHVQRDRDDIQVSGALAVSEKRAFHAVRAGHQAKLGSRDAGAAVVVGVEGNGDGIAPIKVAAHPLDHVGVDVRRGPLDGVRQVDDHLFFRRRLPYADHRVADLRCEIQLGVREGFRRILEDHLRLRDGRNEFLDELRAVDGDLFDRLLRGVAESHAALQRRGRVVDVDDGALRPGDGLEAAADELLARLHQDLDRDILRNAVFLDQAAAEVELRIRGGGETDLDLLEADAHQEIEELQLFLDRHRLRQRLVAVT